MRKGERPAYIVPMVKRESRVCLDCSSAVQNIFSVSLNQTIMNTIRHCCYWIHFIDKVISMWWYGLMKISALSYLCLSTWAALLHANCETWPRILFCPSKVFSASHFCLPYISFSNNWMYWGRCCCDALIYICSEQLQLPLISFGAETDGTV